MSAPLANDLTDLCTVLYGWAEATWDTLLADARFGGPGGAPETYITHDLMRTLRSRFGHLVHIWQQREYHGITEGGATGPNADWEWWVADDRGWNGIRVQAKRLDPSSGRYPDLNRKEDDRRLQAERLVDNAMALAARPMPLYCFYNAWPDPPQFDLPADVAANTMRRDWGATVVPAPRVLEAIERRLAAKRARRHGEAFVGFTSFDLHEHQPLARLFCTPVETARARLAEWIRLHADVAAGPEGEPRWDPVGLDELPPWTQDVVELATGVPDFATAAAERLAEYAGADDVPGTVIVSADHRETLERAAAELRGHDG